MTTPPASPEPPNSADAADLDGLGGGPGRGQSGRRRVLKWISISLVTIIVIGVGGVFADAWYLNHKIHHDPFFHGAPAVVVSGKTESAAPAPSANPLAANAQNFVLIGSDSRKGKSGKGTGASDVQGARSDTTIILHIDKNNSGATLISIPRDSYVRIPACQTGPAKTDVSLPQMSKFNAAFSIGGENDPRYGPSCTVNTIEQDTGIHINHYAVVDFSGFESMVKALGGVRMCVAHPLVDPIEGNHEIGFHGSGLDLPAGKSVEINGQQALDLMRARYALDGGGDLPRIKRQQQFIGAMIRKATSTGLLVHPLELQRFLSAAASSLTTDSGFGFGAMKTLAEALHKEGAGSVRLLTVPNLLSYPGMPYGDVEWDPTKAPELWKAIIDDEPVPGTKVKPTASPSTSASPSVSPSASPTQTGPQLSVAPNGIDVNVENGTTQTGIANKVAKQLKAQGFNVQSVGDAPDEDYTRTEIEYGSTKVQSSQTVKESIPGSKRVADATAGTTITVIVGANYTTVLPVTLGNRSTTSSSPTPSPTESISSFSAAKKGCLS